MIKFKTKLKDFTIPTSWSDIKCSDLNFFQDASEHEIIERITGLTIDEQVFIDLNDIVPYIGFLQENPFETLEKLDFYKDVQLPSDVGECSFEKKIQACSNLDNPIKVLSVYSGVGEEFILNDNVESVYGAYLYLLDKVNEIIERDNNALESRVTEEQKRAGIEMFNQLGDFNTIDLIARDYNYTHSEVERLPYNLIFLILFRMNISSKFEKNYNEIIKER
jgi:hypothetical protein